MQYFLLIIHNLSRNFNAVRAENTPVDCVPIFVQSFLDTPKRQIARLLGRNISTVRREIKRGSVVQRKTKQYINYGVKCKITA